MKTRLILIGCGTVGRGILEILDGKAEFLKKKHGFEAKITAVADLRQGTVVTPGGLDIERALGLLETGKTLADYPRRRTAREPVPTPLEIIAAAEADIVIEVTETNIRTGEPAAAHIRAALQSGKDVVTTNKGPIALHYRELSGLAARKKRRLRFEGTVLSGTPVFTLLERGFAGNALLGVRGILNGTTNFILSKMESDGMEYADALALAQRLGYAEADPAADVEGLDAMAKVAILANVALGGDIKPAAIETQGIAGLTSRMILDAKAEGCRYKLIGYARREAGRIVAGVSPRKLPLTDPLAGVMGAENALTFDLDLMGPVTIRGAGAGRLETGEAVLQDLLAIHHDRACRPGVYS